MLDPSPEAGTGPAPPRTRRPCHAWLAVVVTVVGSALIGCAGAQQAPPPVPAAAGAPTVNVSTPAAPAAQVAPRPRPQTPPGSLPQAAPAALNIPALDVSSPVNQVGLNPDRTMQVPQPGPLYDQAAWFRSSPAPGETGPAVIIGHVDSATDGPSVFYRLGDLKAGDRIEVTRADRSTATFAVETVETFSKDAFPTQTVYGDTTGPELRLITCGGPFDSAAGSYRDNTVVFARQLT